MSTLINITLYTGLTLLVVFIWHYSCVLFGGIRYIYFYKKHPRVRVGNLIEVVDMGAHDTYEDNSLQLVTHINDCGDPWLFHKEKYHCILQCLGGKFKVIEWFNL